MCLRPNFIGHQWFCTTFMGQTTLFKLAYRFSRNLVVLQVSRFIKDVIYTLLNNIEWHPIARQINVDIIVAGSLTPPPHPNPEMSTISYVTCYITERTQPPTLLHPHVTCWIHDMKTISALLALYERTHYWLFVKWTTGLTGHHRLAVDQ